MGMGHNPTLRQLQEEWGRLDPDGRQQATRHDYIAWLQTSENPNFRQHAPPLEESNAEVDTAGMSPSTRRKRKELVRSKPAFSTANRPLWNPYYNTARNPNDELPQGRRDYFSRPRSVASLMSHYSTHYGFEQQRTALQAEVDDVPDRRRYYKQHAGFKGSCSDNAPLTLPQRYWPAGKMRGKDGHIVKWKD